MQKILIFLTFAGVTGFSLSAAEIRTPYGKQGGVEASLAFSTLTTTHTNSNQGFNLNLQPYVNHFVLDRLFLRYALGMVYFYNSYLTFTGVSLRPGFGLGYSFPLSEKWTLNGSIVYNASYGWSYDDFYGKRSGIGAQRLGINPELKYFITEKWIASVFMTIDTSIPEMIKSSGEPFSVSTTTYIVLSYYFP